MGPTVRIRDSLPSNLLASRCSPGRASEEPRGAKVFSLKANPGSPARSRLLATNTSFTTSAFIGTNSRIHLKWNSGFDPSFGVLRRFLFKAGDHLHAIRRTRRDAVRSGGLSATSISRKAQYLGMDTVSPFALSGWP